MNWTRWAVNLQLCPGLCEQVNKLLRVRGGLAVRAKKGGREVSAPGNELVSWQYCVVKGDEPVMRGLAGARLHPNR